MTYNVIIIFGHLSVSCSLINKTKLGLFELISIAHILFNFQQLMFSNSFLDSCYVTTLPN